MRWPILLILVAFGCASIKEGFRQREVDLNAMLNTCSTQCLDIGLAVEGAHVDETMNTTTCVCRPFRSKDWEREIEESLK